MTAAKSERRWSRSLAIIFSTRSTSGPGTSGRSSRNELLTDGFGLMERRFPRQQEIKSSPEAIHVHPAVDAMAVARLLRRKVVRRPQQAARELLLLARQAGQAQVKHLDRAVPVEQQVGRLDVPMDHAEAM